MDRTDLRREEKIAQRFIRRNSLVPPIDVLSLVSRYADVEVDSLPANADAVCLYNREKPLVIIDEWKSPYRKRFTLAHELGHLIIPWHIGTLSCHTDTYDSGGYADYLYSSIEAEANRFASEILMPSEWIRGIIEEFPTPEQLILQVSQICQVSIIAASIAVMKNLQSGYLLIILQDGEIVYNLKSSGTPINLSDGEIDEGYLSRMSKEHGEFLADSYEMKWWNLNYSSPVVDTVSDARKSTVILSDILQEVVQDPERRKKFLHSINGIIGSANSVCHTEDSYYKRLKQKLVHRLDLKDVVLHPDFETFLVKKIKELVEKKKSK